MMERFSEQYRQFLDKGKTEFEVVEEIWAAALERDSYPTPRLTISHSVILSPVTDLYRT